MKIKDLQKAINSVSLSERNYENIAKKIMDRKKERFIMSKKKIGIIAAALVVVMGIGVYATSGIITGMHCWSSSEPDYKSVPTADVLKKDIGFSPIIIDEFENGYVFDSATVVKNAYTYEGESEETKAKSLSAEYKKADDVINLTAMEAVEGMTEEGELAAEIDGISLYYSEDTYKIVPPDYVMTEEDKAKEESGELVFSYGSEKPYLTEFKFVLFDIDGIRYDLFQNDGELTKEDLINMSKEIIKK